MTLLKSCLAASTLLALTFSGAAPAGAEETPKEQAMLVQYLEIVSSDVDATCNVLAKVHGVSFGEPEPGLANARTAALKGGGRIGVRAPMAGHDKPIVRPYARVDKIDAAVKAAEAAGAVFAMRATAIPGGGKFAIYFQGGIQHGLWSSSAPAKEAQTGKALQVQYLEVVSSDVDATCSTLAKVHGVRFGEPDPAMGNARTAPLEGGGRIGVRAPMAEHEKPVVRSYALVDDIEAAIQAAEAAGAVFAMRATPIPGGGKFAIYLLEGAQLGLWQR